MIQIMGALHRVAIDKEGESKVTFSIPLSEIKQITELTQMTEQLLKITIESETS